MQRSWIPSELAGQLGRVAVGEAAQQTIQAALEGHNMRAGARLGPRERCGGGAKGGLATGTLCKLATDSRQTSLQTRQH